MKFTLYRPWMPGALMWLLLPMLSVGQKCYSQESGDPAPGDAAATVAAQAEMPAASTDGTGKKFRRRLPAHFSAVVTLTQRQKIYEIQEGYFRQIVALEEQLAKLKEKRDADVDEVLTPEQLAEVKQKREAAANRRKSSSASTAEGTAES